MQFKQSKQSILEIQYIVKPYPVNVSSDYRPHWTHVIWWGQDEFVLWDDPVAKPRAKYWIKIEKHIADA